MSLPIPFPGALAPLAGGQYLRLAADAGPVGAVLAVALVLYLWGVRRNNRLHPRHPWPAARTAAFVGALLSAAVAVCGFLGAYDRVLFWDHMVQHLLLIMVTGGLLAAGAPVALVWRASTGGAHRAVTGALRSRAGRLLGHPATAFVLYAVLVPVTHLTAAFNWAVEHESVDVAEHVLFAAIGYLFWRQVFGAEPNRYRAHPAARAVLLFLAVPVDTFVGLSLDSESREIFPALAAVHRHWGMGLVQDLHVGGVIMWVGGDVLMTAALVPVVVAWVRSDERRASRADAELAAYFPAPGGQAAGQPTAGYALGTFSGRRRGAGRGAG